MPQLIKPLLLLSTIFLFVSSSAAAALGLQSLRVALFIVVIAAVCAVACAAYPYFSARGRTAAIVLIWLVALSGLSDLHGRIELLDYKLLLPVAVLLFTPNIARALDPIDLARAFFTLLTLYIITTAALLALGGSLVVARGYGQVIRYDITGSLITHASLCGIHMILCAVRAVETPIHLKRLGFLLLMLPSAAMVMMVATRTVIVLIIVFAVLVLVAGPRRSTRLIHLLLLLLGGSLAFVGYTVFIDDTFFLRLFTTAHADYTSGRLESIREWLALGSVEPLGLGMGSTRELLNSERPFLSSGSFLEWPHNEFVRLYVEGGVLGLVIITTLIGSLVFRALRHANATSSGLSGHLALAIVADMIAQSLLQNYFNTIYHATVMTMLLCLLIELERPTSKPRQSTM